MKKSLTANAPRHLTPTAFTAQHDGTGTKQWSKHSFNICIGCMHNCAYCYAKSMAHRFGRGSRNWFSMAVDPRKVQTAARKFDGVVMFPTSHDITPAILPDCLTTIQNLLSHGNDVLIVSKPHLDVTKSLCNALAEYREHILFRFTIGSPKAATCQLWEPGAPAPQERIQALRYAYEQGYHTSVSMEPMLEDVHTMIQLVSMVSPSVSDTVWLGKMNGGFSTKMSSMREELQKAKLFLKAAHSNYHILQLVKALVNNPKVRWKDSILKVQHTQAASIPTP